jgi:amino acid adenylation domain-containing protein
MNDIEMHEADSHGDRFRLSPQQRLSWAQQAPRPSLTLAISSQASPDELARYLQLRLAHCVEQHESLRIELQQMEGLTVPLQSVMPVQSSSVHINTTEDHNNPNIIDGPLGIEAMLKTMGDGYYQLKLRLPALSADRGTLHRLAQALLTPDFAAAPVLPASEDEDDEAMDYSQYASWLYELQSEEEASEGLAYWQQQAADIELDASIPYRDEDGASTQHAYAETTISLDQQHSQQIQQCCEQHQVQLQQVLFSAWASVLQRLSHNDEDAAILVNWIHDCRDDYEELDQCWGQFAKALPIRWCLDEQKSIVSSQAELAQALENASEWQEYYAVNQEPHAAWSRYGFEWAGNTVQGCTIIGTSIEPDTGKQLTIRVCEVETHVQQFELLLVAEQRNDGLRLQLKYDTQHYGRQAANILLEQFCSLLMDALAQPQQALRQLSMASATVSALHQPLADQDLQNDIQSDELIPTLISQSAEQHPQLTALMGLDANGHSCRWTYAELEQQSNQLAHALQAKGIGPSHRVALFLPRSPQTIIAMLAVLKTGAAYVPLEPQQPPQRSQHMLRLAAPKVVIHNGDWPDQFDIDTLDFSQFDGESFSSEPVQCSVHPDQAAYILFTSGSSGTPKGVLISHRALHNYCRSIVRRVHLSPSDKSAIVTSLAADLSYTLLFPTLLRGGELHIIPRDLAMNPAAWASYQNQHGIHHIKTVPSLLEIWFNYDQARAVLPLSQLLLGGEHCRPELLETLRRSAPELTVYNHYGPSEATVGVMVHASYANQLPPTLPLSQCLEHTAVYLLDEHLEWVPPGQIGHLYIAGANLARGYLSARPTAMRFIPNPFSDQGERLYQTGDLARYRSDGSIQLLGRADRQVKVRGFRVELDEIELALSQLAAVHQVAVIDASEQESSARLFAFLTLHPGHNDNAQQLQQQLAQHLPEHMLPRLRIVPQLPLLASGKTDRQNLLQQAQQWMHQGQSAPPRNDLEALLCQLWAEVLGLEQVGIDDDFFAMGGHSLAAVKLASRLQKLLSSPITVNVVFNAPTVARFARLIQQELNLSPLVDLTALAGVKGQAPVMDSVPNLFCFHPSTGHVHDYRSVAEQLPHWQLWGLQAHDNSIVLNSTNLHELAQRYVQEIRQQQAHGPYHLLGWSLGGLLAMAAAQQLEQLGEAVRFLGIVDSQRHSQSMQPDNDADVLNALFDEAIEQLDTASRELIQALGTHERQRLIEQISQCAPQERTQQLSQWAQQQGLQLANEHWDELNQRLQQDLHIQGMIEQFSVPSVNVAAHIWWASDTLERFADSLQSDHWQGLGTAPQRISTIQAQHLDILQQTSWQQQLTDDLNKLKQDVTPSQLNDGAA